MTDLVEALRRVTAALPASEERPGQLEMAGAVASAISRRRHLLVQAGTGTGKSIAYLVPAILSGRRCVVATATKALQDQLAGTDLPFLAAHLGAPFDFAVLKGRANYVCRQRALEIAGGADQLDLDGGESDVSRLGGQVRRLLEWSVASPTGERSELGFEPDARAWGEVSVSALECPGAARCPTGDACFAELARERAAQAQVVVVNMHLYAAHVASGGHVLPDHDVVVFDEAHELEDVASAALGVELGAARLRALARNARALVDDPALLDGLQRSGQGLQAALEPWRGRRVGPGLPASMAEALALASDRVARLAAAARRPEAAPERDARRARVLQAAGHLAGDLAFLVSIPESYVAWVEGAEHAPALRAAPVDVGPLLAEQLWPNVSAVLTSATVPPGLSRRIGIAADQCDEIDVGSPFAFEQRALLYCATDLPDPRRPEHQAAVHAELEALITAAGGRTLALFTSWRAMDEAARALRPRLGWTLLTQADLPKPALIDAFRRDETSCLFATMGFWQGVDVPGPSLSLVVLDRIPFPRPDEPLMQARRDRAGPDAFRLVDLPRAATLLAQGAGRLIRSTTDRGVVAVLDPRLATAGYRWELVRALPPMRRTRSRQEVEAFLAPLRA
jgi:ATP-dependent DNA helicase DinG